MTWLRLCVLVVALWAAPSQAVVGGEPAAPPEPDAAVVFTQKYGYSARLQGHKDDRRGYYTFAGIRYAEPPLGPRRFQRPIRKYLMNEINATTFCPPCPQMDPRGSKQVIGNEDCLCLNLYAPKMPGGEEGCPVVFFIHGGNYKSGSASPYGGQHFAQKDTIIVTAQYRLGSLGFLSTGQRDASGNTGLFDLHAAMAWITDYIEFFGGDPTRVVVMGQGSGGSAASLLALSNNGRSATGVAALSGAPLSPGAVKQDPKKIAEALAQRTGCPPSPAEKLLMCLRKQPAQKLIQIDKEIGTNPMETEAFLEDISGRSGSGARVEGPDDARALPPLVEESPAEALQRRVKRIPLLTGVTSSETSNAVFGKYEKFLSEQLKVVKDFIKNDLVGGLKGVVQSVEGLNPLKIPAVNDLLLLPDYYQAIFDSSLNAIDGLSQIAEATGDALFNFPAYQSVRAWSNSAPALMYSFEHVGNLSKGAHFLPGMALTAPADLSEASKKKKIGPAHGDELAYLFEPLDDQGNSISKPISASDARARESFVNLIANFAHNLNKSKDSVSLFGFQSYSASTEQFLKITEKVTADKDFRFCQMGLWGNIADRLTDTFCKNFLNQLLNLPKLVFPGTAVVPNINNVNILGQGLGILGSRPPKANKPSWSTAFNPLGMA